MAPLGRQEQQLFFDCRPQNGQQLALVVELLGQPMVLYRMLYHRNLGQVIEWLDTFNQQEDTVITVRVGFFED